MYKHKTSKHPDFLKTVNNIRKSVNKLREKCLLTVLNCDRNLRNIFMSLASSLSSHYLYICNTDKRLCFWILWSMYWQTEPEAACVCKIGTYCHTLHPALAHHTQQSLSTVAFLLPPLCVGWWVGNRLYCGTDCDIDMLEKEKSYQNFQSHQYLESCLLTNLHQMLDHK